MNRCLGLSMFAKDILLVPLLFIVILTSGLVNTAEDTHIGYFISIPSVVTRNATATTCLIFNATNSDIEVNFTLKIPNEARVHVQRHLFVKGEDDCFELQVPNFISRRQAILTAQPVLHSKNGDVKLPMQKRDLRVIINNEIYFIQTDKAVYMPGQTVKFRVYSVDMDLIPSNKSISLITVQNSAGFVVHQWKHVQPHKGLSEHEFVLTQVTSEGTWFINLQDTDTRKSFNVTKYVLPKFEVTLQAPRYITFSTLNFDVEICARYTYDKPVHGSLYLQQCRGETCFGHREEILGCKTVQVDSMEEEITNNVMHVNGVRFEKSENERIIKLRVKVTESATGLVVSAPNVEIPISKTDVKIEINKLCPKTFKPGIPYVGKVRVYFINGSPARNMSIHVSMIHDGDPPDGMNMIRHELSVTTNHDGESLFTLPALSALVDQFEIKILALPPGIENEDDHCINTTIYRFVSPSESYLQIHPTTKLPGCTQQLSLNMSYILSRELDTNVTLRYQLMSASSRKLSSGSKKVKLSPSEKRSRNLVDPWESNQLPYNGTLYIGMVPARLTYLDSFKDMAIIPDPSQIIGCYGNVVQWSIYIMRKTKRHRRVHLQVWRPIPNTPKRYSLAGETIIMYTEKGRYEKQLDKDNQIAVEPDDVLGIYFPKNGPIPFDVRNCDNENGLFMMNPDRMRIGNQYSFTGFENYSQFACRDYSVQAKVELDHYILEQMQHKLIPKPLNWVIDLPAPLGVASELVVYYVNDAGETIVDSVLLDTVPCLNNKVTMQFHTKNAFPGETVFYKLQAEPGSMCSIGVVDKSVNLLKSSNDIDEEKLIGKPQQTYLATKEKVKAPSRHCGEEKKSGLQDALDIFNTAGLTIMTNFDVDNKPCNKKFGESKIAKIGSAVASRAHHQDLKFVGHVQLSSHGVLAQPNMQLFDEPVNDMNNEIPDVGSSALERRFYFPDTWIWNTHDIGVNGVLELNSTLPHTMTEWSGSAICLHPDVGMGITNSVSLKAFQAFFLSLQLPYSIKNGERLHLKLVVFNYLGDCLALRITGTEPEGLGLISFETEQLVCVCDESLTINYTVQPYEVGTIPISFTAEVVEEQGVCPHLPKFVMPLKDTIEKELLVKAEGKQEIRTETKLLCPNDYSQEILQNMELQLPPDFVPDSQYAEVNIIADVMGPTLDNAHKLLKLPVGCAEYNLARLALDIVALDYLIKSHQLKDKHRTKALTYIERGYQQQLAFVREDFSYSSFGTDDFDTEGSLWLSAAVLKTLSKAQRYIFADKLESTTKWILSHQDGYTGCFKEIGKIENIHLQGGLQANTSDVALSAFVISALLEAGKSSIKSEIRRGLNCLTTNSNTNDVYTLSLIAYAFSLTIGDLFQLQQVLQKLEDKVIINGGLAYWKAGDDETYVEPVDIEATAYVLLAKLNRARPQDMVSGASSVRWLVQQRDSKGFFPSAQASIVAVEALAKYASMNVHQDLSVRAWLLETPGGKPSYEVNITEENRLLMHRWPVGDLPKQIKVGATGKGCLLAQTTVHYNRKPKAKPDSYYALDVSVLPIDHQMANTTSGDCPRYQCKLRKVRICARFVHPTQSVARIVVVKLSLVSGWLYANNHSVSLCHELQDCNYSMVSAEDDKLTFLFYKMGKHHTCIDVTIEQAHEISNTTEALVHVMGIHHSEERGQSQTYMIEEVCTPEEYEMFCFLPPMIN